MKGRKTWAIVLAAGDGTRLASLTADERGNAVPKQYCSLSGGQSLLQEALLRARHVAPRGRVCTIVARSHECYWRPALRSMPAGNVIIQPRNCGTANGVLLAVLQITRRDPRARLLFLPADHYVSDGKLLSASMRAAARWLARDSDGLLLVGIEPDELDPELGYIVPGAPAADGTRSVLRFVEKPPLADARDLVASGALWNSFIFAAQASTLHTRLRTRFPQTVSAMSSALARDSVRNQGAPSLDALYEQLDPEDFSRAIVQGAESTLRVLAAPACGWADLGTPRRVARVLQRLSPVGARRARNTMRPLSAVVDLASQYARLSMASY